MSDVDSFELEPDVPALNAWAEDPYHQGHDRPSIRVWYPREAPYAIVQTLSRGCESVYLPDPAHPKVDVHLAGGLQIGGDLAEIEAYFAAVIDALKLARWQADHLSNTSTEVASR